MNRTISPLLAGLVLVIGLSACGGDDSTTDVSDSRAAERAADADDRAETDIGDTLPAPIAAMRERGVEVVGRFETPTDLVGYAATIQGRPMAIYLTADGEHAVIGSMIDASGDNLTGPALDEAVGGPRAERAWETFENDGDWVQDGDPDAPRVVYEITDPNCPFCAEFNTAARPWVDAGDVQIRHVMVGIIRPESLAQAATIVGADDPAARLLAHFNGEGIEAADDLPPQALARIRANNEQMRELGYRATPTILYRDDNADIRAKQGMPRGDELEAILGPRP